MADTPRDVMAEAPESGADSQLKKTRLIPKIQLDPQDNELRDKALRLARAYVAYNAVASAAIAAKEDVLSSPHNAFEQLDTAASGPFAQTFAAANEYRAASQELFKAAYEKNKATFDVFDEGAETTRGITPKTRPGQPNPDNAPTVSLKKLLNSFVAAVACDSHLESPDHDGYYQIQEAQALRAGG